MKKVAIINRPNLAFALAILILPAILGFAAIPGGQVVEGLFAISYLGVFL